MTRQFKERNKGQRGRESERHNSPHLLLITLYRTRNQDICILRMCKSYVLAIAVMILRVRSIRESRFIPRFRFDWTKYAAQRKCLLIKKIKISYYWSNYLVSLLLDLKLFDIVDCFNAKSNMLISVLINVPDVHCGKCIRVSFMWWRNNIIKFTIIVAKYVTHRIKLLQFSIRYHLIDFREFAKWLSNLCTYCNCFVAIRACN